jgi:glycerophosphoryl diester phosphodiesterase
MASIVAHRGASAQAPENTLKAFDLAIKLGAEVVELDVWQTTDGVLVINHDPKIDGVRIDESTYSKIKSIPGGADIATLREALELISGRVQLYVEIKSHGYEKAVVDMVLEYFALDKFAVISFRDEVIATVKQYNKNIYAGLLLAETIDGKIVYDRHDVFPLRRFRACQADFLAPRYFPPTSPVLLQARLLNIPLYIWTINKPFHYKLLTRVKNVQTVATDMPPAMQPDNLKKSAKPKPYLKAKARVKSYLSK